MKNILRFVTGMILTSGIALTIGNQLIYASVVFGSGGGAQLQMHSAAPAEIQTTMEATSAVLPAYEQANASVQMVVGILLILLGFFLHGLLASHDERTVKVKAVPRKKQAHKTSKKHLFWMEMRV